MGTAVEMDPFMVQLMMQMDMRHKIELVRHMIHPTLCNMTSVVHTTSNYNQRWNVVDASLEQDAAQGLAVRCWSDGAIELEVPEPVTADCRVSFFLLEPWCVISKVLQPGITQGSCRMKGL